MDYSNIEEISRTLGEKNDCAVRAVAIATGISYTEVHAELTRQGRKRGRRTPLRLTEAAVKNLGFELQQVLVKSATVRTIARELTEGTYLVRVRGHILCLKDGKVEDWSDGRLLRIVEVLRVVIAGTPEPAMEPIVLEQYKPAAPRMKGAKELIHRIADEMWNEAGQPLHKARVLKLRLVIMDVLEYKHGVKRSTASNELGSWQKTLPLI